MPYKNPERQRAAQREWDRTHRPEHAEAFFGQRQRKHDLETILKRTLTWDEFVLYDTGEAVSPDYAPRGAEGTEPPK